MLTLQRARSKASDAGEPLPTVFNNMAAAGVHFRQSQLTLVAAAPGVGKSLVAVTVAVRSRVPTLYYSADSDEHTMYTRIGAMLTGWDTRSVEESVRDKTPGYRTVEEAISNVDNVRWSFNPDPDTGDLESDLQAFAGVYGEWPKLIVVDNLKDLYGSTDEGDMSLGDRCKYLKVVARNTGACVIALHHVVGEYEDGNKPVPLSGLMEKVGKIPEMVLTMDRNATAVTFDGAQTMNLRPVKNRGGKADGSAAWSIPLTAYMDKMTLLG